MSEEQRLLRLESWIDTLEEALQDVAQEHALDSDGANPSVCMCRCCCAVRRVEAHRKVQSIA